MQNSSYTSLDYTKKCGRALQGQLLTGIVLERPLGEYLPIQDGAQHLESIVERVIALILDREIDNVTLLRGTEDLHGGAILILEERHSFGRVWAVVELKVRGRDLLVRSHQAWPWEITSESTPLLAFAAVILAASLSASFSVDRGGLFFVFAALGMLVLFVTSAGDPFRRRIEAGKLLSATAKDVVRAVLQEYTVMGDSQQSMAWSANW